MSHRLQRHRMHPHPGTGQHLIEETLQKLIGADLCLGRLRSGNLDPKKIRENLIRNLRHNSPSVRQPNFEPEKIRAEFIWFSRHKIGRRQHVILEHEFGLNYGLSPFEVRRARLKNNFV